jgi:ribosomal protein S18 acetylase RimI-like enzyme
LRIERLGPSDAAAVLAASNLFDVPPHPGHTDRFLAADDHHLLMASVDGAAVGFVSGVETTHPDKGTEMFLYELSVHPGHRRRGIATALVAALQDLARERGCYGMWVATEPDNVAAIEVYRGAGAARPESAVVLDWAFGETRNE